MNVKELLTLIPSSALTDLAIDTEVDHYSKKLQGEVVFKLLLHCIITHKETSLRSIASAYESLAFQALNKNKNHSKICYNSISERLSVINVDYFEKLYSTCVLSYKNILGKEGDEIIRFDSTIVSLSSLLLDVGYHLGGDNNHLKQLKFTIGYSDIPEFVNFYTDKQFTSENTALKESIYEHSKQEKKLIRVFDRGITSRKTYDELIDKKINFVTRINANALYKQVSPNSLKEPLKTDTLFILSDSWGYLFASEGKETKHKIRRIEALRIENNEKLTIISNLKNVTAEEITEFYKKRWDIEVFFKFIKQHLTFSHLINRSENGIKVILYITMIAAILILAYKKTNQLKGFKIVKQEFAQQLEKEIVKDLILLCGGDPEKLDKVLKNNTT
jgi:Transposase DDE domain